MATSTDRAKRKFHDAPYGERCMATVTLKDGSLAQCGRYRKLGILCLQHHRMGEKANRTQKNASLRAKA